MDANPLIQVKLITIIITNSAILSHYVKHKYSLLSRAWLGTKVTITWSCLVKVCTNHIHISANIVWRIIARSSGYSYVDSLAWPDRSLIARAKNGVPGNDMQLLFWPVTKKFVSHQNGLRTNFCSLNWSPYQFPSPHDNVIPERSSMAS